MRRVLIFAAGAAAGVAVARLVHAAQMGQVIDGILDSLGVDEPIDEPCDVYGGELTHRSGCGAEGRP